MDRNHEMWNDLNMDLDKHDLLCEALPQAFGDVFLSQDNRPEKMDYFNAVAADIHGLRPSLGARFDRTCPFFRIADLFVGETTCDGKKKAWEILAEDAPMYIMDIPQMKRDEDFIKWEKEIKLYIDRLEELTGNKVSAESLHDAIVMINKKRAAMQRLYDFRKLDNVPIGKCISI